MIGSDDVAVCTSSQVSTEVELSAETRDSCSRVSESSAIWVVAEGTLCGPLRTMFGTEVMGCCRCDTELMSS